MLTQDRWLLPEGIDEVFPKEAARMEFLRSRILNLFASWGYQLVIPPLIDFLDSLLVGTGHDLDLQTFKLIDQISGRLMGVRADMTPQVARIDARTSGSDAPKRLCYLGTVLHTQIDHLEKSRSPLQVGAELYGHAGNASDLEIIRLMLEMLAIAGIEKVFLDLGHVGIYRGLARQAGLSPGQEAELFQILQRKDCPELLSFLDGLNVDSICADMLMALVELNGHTGVIEAARQRLSGARECVHRALDDLEVVAEALNRLFPGLPVNFDLAELRAYHYQTGVVFAAFVSGYGREIARGGRYDDIGKVFGRARPATGFSADLKVLARLSSIENVETDQAVIYAPAIEDSDLYRMIARLRGSGRIVIQALPGQAGTGSDMGCTLQLSKVDSIWQISKIDG